MKVLHTIHSTLLTWRGRLDARFSYSPIKSDCEEGDVVNENCLTERNDGSTEAKPIPKADKIQPKESKWEHHMLGLVLAIAAGLFMAFGSLFVKLARSVPYFEMLIARSIGILTFCLPFTIYYNESLVPFSIREFIFIFGRGSLSCGAFAAMYFSFQFIPLMDSMAIVFTHPVITAILSFYILKESWGVFDCVALVLSIAGVTLITRPSFIFSHSNSIANGYTSSAIWRNLGIAAAIGASVSDALSFICVRKLKKSGPFVILFYYGVVGIAMGFLLGFAEGGLKYPNCGTPDNWYAVFCAICTFGGQLSMTYALTIEEAATVALGRTTNLAFVFVLQSILLHTPFNGLSFGGTLLILLSSVTIFLKKQYTKANKQQL